MVELSKIRLLIVAPHPDDEVIGCGGLISKVKAAGGDVHVIFMTVGVTVDFSGYGQSKVEERMEEIKRAAAYLNIDSWRVVWQSDESHLRLDQMPQREIIHELERGKDISLEILKPNLIALPMIDDYNQDHRAAGQAGLAACRPVPRKDKFVPDMVWHYETPMNQWQINGITTLPNVVVKLGKREMARKVRAMEIYASQTRRGGHLRNTDTMRALAGVRGPLIGEALGEGYFSRMINIRS